MALTHIGTAITSLRIPYAHQRNSELYLDLESFLIRTKKGQPLPDNMPDSLQPFTILQHKTLAEAKATADWERSKLVSVKVQP